MQILKVSQRSEQSSYDEFGDAPSLFVCLFFFFPFSGIFNLIFQLWAPQTLFSEFPSQQDCGFSI